MWLKKAEKEKLQHETKRIVSLLFFFVLLISDGYRGCCFVRACVRASLYKHHQRFSSVQSFVNGSETVTMQSLKKSFYIPPSYTFPSSYSNPATVISLASFVSTCSSPLNYLGGLRPYYQQQKCLTPSSSSSTSVSTATVPIHSTEEDIFETPPSSAEPIDEDRSRINPFEVLAKKERALNKNQVRNHP